MFRKIITYFLILAVVLPIFASVVPLDIKTSYAQEDETTVTQTIETKKGDTTETVSKVTKKTSSDGEVYDPCGWFFGAGQKGGIIECLSYTITGILYDYVLQGTIWIAGLAGTLFNASIQFSLTGKVFDAKDNLMIKDGWTLVRDLLNLIFIFVLLFAAISTILQYGNMDIKKVLPSLIVAALLVNFSMMIAKMVIDASHIFAWEFYNQIDVKNEEGLGDGKMFANIKNDINVYGYFEKKNLANVFIAGFNPQELLTGKEAKEGEEDSSANNSLWKQVVEAKRDEGVNINGVWWQAALIILLESALALFAGFVLLAGAIMFVIRVVVLWLVMIFSPIAFLSMLLPSMKKYSDMWWEYLINQSFFAPAFLFMFMLVTKFINSKFVESIFQVSKNSDPMIVWGINGGTIALTFFHFFVVGALMMACLIVARQLGGKTAEFGISWAHKGKELALGGAKKLAWSPARYGLRYGGGYLADKTLDKKEGWGEKRWAKTLTSIPGVGTGLKKLGAMKKADEKAEEKKAQKYAEGLSDAGFEYMKKQKEEAGIISRVVYGGGLLPSTKKGYGYAIEKKKKEDERKRKIEDEKEELKALQSVEQDAFIFKDKFKKEIEKLEEAIGGLDTDLVAQNYKLAKAIEEKDKTDEGLALDAIDIMKKEKLKKNAEKKIKEEKIKKIEKQETRVKELEDKEDRRKETEGLQETIKTSGSSGSSGGGGGASKSGGGKTTP